METWDFSSSRRRRFKQATWPLPTTARCVTPFPSELRVMHVGTGSLCAHCVLWQAWESRQQGLVLARSAGLVTGELLFTSASTHATTSIPSSCSGCGVLFTVTTVSTTETAFDYGSQAILRVTTSNYQYDGYSNPVVTNIVTTGVGAVRQSTEVSMSFTNAISDRSYPLFTCCLSIVLCGPPLRGVMNGVFNVALVGFWSACAAPGCWVWSPFATSLWRAPGQGLHPPFLALRWDLASPDKIHGLRCSVGRPSPEYP